MHSPDHLPISKMSLVLSARPMGLPGCRASRWPRRSSTASQIPSIRHRLRTRAVNRPVDACQDHDVVQVETSAGSIEFLEVIQGWSAAEQSCKLLWKGQLLQLKAVADQQPGSLKVEALGAWDMCMQLHASIMVETMSMSHSATRGDLSHQKQQLDFVMSRYYSHSSRVSGNLKQRRAAASLIRDFWLSATVCWWSGRGVPGSRQQGRHELPTTCSSAAKHA